MVADGLRDLGSDVKDVDILSRNLRHGQSVHCSSGNTITRRIVMEKSAACWLMRMYQTHLFSNNFFQRSRKLDAALAYSRGCRRKIAEFIKKISHAQV